MADIDDIRFDFSVNGDPSLDVLPTYPLPPSPFHGDVTEQESIVEPPITFIDQEQTIRVKNITPFDIIFFTDAKAYLFDSTAGESSSMTASTKSSAPTFFQRIINFLRFPTVSQQDLDFNRQCEQLLHLTKYPCVMSDRMHLRILYTIYRRLTNSKDIFYTTFGAHWEEIGFQSSNPETDFRSTGLFSVLFLLYFVDSMYLPLAKQIYLFSRDQTQEFPFCCVGINLANMLIKYLRQAITSRTSLRKLTNETSAIDFVGRLFIALYLSFYLKWRENGYTISHTQQVFSELEKTLQNQPRMLFQEFDDYFRRRQEHQPQQYELKPTNDNLI